MLLLDGVADGPKTASRLAPNGKGLRNPRHGECSPCSVLAVRYRRRPIIGCNPLINHSSYVGKRIRPRLRRWCVVFRPACSRADPERARIDRMVECIAPLPRGTWTSSSTHAPGPLRMRPGERVDGCGRSDVIGV